jgi:DNA-binding MarR family transcriptional regulator
MSSSARKTAGRADALEELAVALRALLTASRRLRGRVERDLPGYAHHHVLKLLSERGELTAGQLAEATDFSAAFITEVLDHLEAERLVQRRRSTQDRRVVLVQLTSRGRRVFSAKHEQLSGRWERALAGLDEHDLAAGGRVIETIRAYFEELADSSEPRGRMRVRGVEPPRDSRPTGT